MNEATEAVTARARVRKEIDANYPPVVIGDFWECYSGNSEVNRRVRILAELNPEHLIGFDKPNGRIFLCQEHPARMRIGDGRLLPVEEFYLRYVFSPAKK